MGKTEVGAFSIFFPTITIPMHQFSCFLPFMQNSMRRGGNEWRSTHLKWSQKSAVSTSRNMCLSTSINGAVADATVSWTESTPVSLWRSFSEIFRCCDIRRTKHCDDLRVRALRSRISCPVSFKKERLAAFE